MPIAGISGLEGGGIGVALGSLLTYVLRNIIQPRNIAFIEEQKSRNQAFLDELKASREERLEARRTLNDLLANHLSHNTEILQKTVDSLASVVSTQQELGRNQQTIAVGQQAICSSLAEVCAQLHQINLIYTHSPT